MEVFTKKGDLHYVPAYYEHETKEEFLLRQIRHAFMLDFSNVNILNATILLEHQDLTLELCEKVSASKEEMNAIVEHLGTMEIIDTCRSVVEKMELDKKEKQNLLDILEKKKLEENSGLCVSTHALSRPLSQTETDELTLLRNLLIKNTGLKRTWKKWNEVAIEHDKLIVYGEELDDPEVVELNTEVDRLEKRMGGILTNMKNIINGGET